MIFILWFVIASCLLAILFKIDFLEAFPISVMISTVLVYFCGLFGSFNTGMVLIFICTAVMLIVTAANFIKNKKFEKLIHFISFEFLFFMAFLLLAFFYSGRLVLEERGDAFSHWAVVIKNYYYINDFATADNSTVTFLAYPPAIAIFSYIVEKMSVQFKDNLVYFSYYVLTLSFIVPAIRIITEKKLGIKKIMATLTISFLPIMYDWSFFYSLKVDVILGVIFAYIIVLYLFLDDGFYKWFAISLAAFFLSISKESGLGLALIATLIIVASEVISNWKCVFITLFPIFGWFSWSLHLSANNISKKSFSLSHIFRTLLNNVHLLPYQKRTIVQFVKEFYSGELTRAYSCLTWLVIIAIIALLCGWILPMTGAVRGGQPRKKYMICITGVFLGFVFYSGMLLMTYLFNFAEEEATRCASFERYMGTYVTGATIIIICMLIKQYFDYTYVLIAVFSVAWLHIIIGTMILLRSPLSEDFKVTRFDNELRIIKELNGDVAYVNTYYNDDTKNRALVGEGIYGYCMFPQKSLTTLFDTSCEGKNLLQEEKIRWLDELKSSESSYVYFDLVDDNFSDVFMDLFTDPYSIHDHSLYRITKTEYDNVKFDFIQNIEN